ncbi:TniQ family protein [Herbaspirillum sp. DW155]|uniref:hypothetical protein n=1 Tax=Herbaspirillum sp. DW155 TaxID=3095609 RepID=UPI0030860271|nr:TniQ family protein [Herbaspirillum sp. DW155]
MEFKSQGAYSIPIQDEENIMAWLATETFFRRKTNYLINSSGTRAHSKNAPWLHPSNIERFVADFPIGLKDAHSVVLNNTCFRLASLLSADEVKDSIYRYALGNNDSTIALGFLGKTKFYRALCSECLSNPGGQYHYAVWDRLFNVPGIKVCPTHKQVLLRPCQSCNEQLQFTRPTMFCCERGMEPVDELSEVEIDFLAKVAASARRVLHGELESLSADSIFAAIATKVREYQEKSDDPDNIIKNRLVEKIGIDGFNRLGISAQTLAKISTSKDDEYRAKHPVNVLTVIHALFENMDSFIVAANCVSLVHKNSVEAISPRNYRGPVPLEEPTLKTIEDLVSVTEKYKSIVEAALEEQPSLTRAKFRKSLGGREIYTHLGIHAADWLKRRFTKQKLKVKGMLEGASSESPMPRNYATSVAKLVEHIRRRHQFLVTSLPEKRITKFALLKNSSYRGNAIIRNSPEVQAALLAYVDDTKKRTYQLRNIGIMCKRVNEKSPGHPYGDEEWYQNLSKPNFNRRLSLLRKWLAQN